MTAPRPQIASAPVIHDTAMTLLDGMTQSAEGASIHLRVLQHYVQIGDMAGIAYSLRSARDCLNAAIRCRNEHVELVQQFEDEVRARTQEAQ